MKLWFAASVLGLASGRSEFHLGECGSDEVFCLQSLSCIPDKAPFSERCGAGESDGGAECGQESLDWDSVTCGPGEVFCVESARCVPTGGPPDEEWGWEGEEDWEDGDWDDDGWATADGRACPPDTVFCLQTLQCVPENCADGPQPMGPDTPDGPKEPTKPSEPASKPKPDPRPPITGAGTPDKLDEAAKQETEKPKTETQASEKPAQEKPNDAEPVAVNTTESATKTTGNQAVKTTTKTTAKPTEMTTHKPTAKPAEVKTSKPTRKTTPKPTRKPKEEDKVASAGVGGSGAVEEAAAAVVGEAPAPNPGFVAESGLGDAIGNSIGAIGKRFGGALSSVFG